MIPSSARRVATGREENYSPSHVNILSLHGREESECRWLFGRDDRAAGKRSCKSLRQKRLDREAEIDGGGYG